MSPPPGIIDKVAWLHIADRRLLCVRTSGRGLFYVPGGKREPDEDDLGTLMREIAEELGVGLIATTVRPAGHFAAPADGNPEKTVEIETYFAEYVGTLSTGFEIAEQRFLASTDADQASAATRQILQHLKAKNVID